jgi:hypothetical protein
LTAAPHNSSQTAGIATTIIAAVSGDRWCSMSNSFMTADFMNDLFGLLALVKRQRI